MATSLRLQNLEVPCDTSYDVIVIGGGPAGCTAAAAAAREGARTLLLEASGCLGGSGTSALVPAWCPFSDKERIIYAGLAATIFARAKEGMAHVKPTDRDWVPIDAERLKRVYDDLVTGAGATVLFHTMLAHVETDRAGRVTGILTANKAGLRAWRASVFVDCTGDADLTAWAGGEFQKGDAAGTHLMPATHCFVLSNVDDYAFRHGPAVYGATPNGPIQRIVASGKYPLISDLHCCCNFVGPGTVGFNAGHIFEVDNTDPASVSAALIQGRKMAAQFRDALAEFHPQAFGNAFLVTTGAQMGIRETRRIVGDYVLTLDDYLQRRSFTDEICRNCYYIDVHWAKDQIVKDKAQMAQWETAGYRYNPGESHGIPYRCLTPHQLRNVLVAGRSISCEQLVQGSVRVMPVCLAMGEAAGLAAALAARHSLADVHAVDVGCLRARLREEGGYLP
ncbi:MAG: hypothetical protein PCFJNLEI_01013 [Verrucomicrobiae bacterium]|nr:hypothetical protein [Verrucomicrobiae bacterium]